eukprot:c2653_g1_i1.p1 GENE.c2653_g1_i1~~c2653_g1_i1.p1  ORF type:complete len:218 (-),score=50.89 c2653_g1_i1:4-657(-)
MSIIYATVSRGSTILAEHATTSGNFVEVTKCILTKIGPQDNKMSYQYDRYMFHYIVDGGLTFLCMTDNTIGRRIPFVFLEDAKTRFRQMFSGKWESAAAYGCNEEFKKTLKKLMETHGMESDRLDRVKGEIDEVKNVMVGNIEKVLGRGEKIDLLVGKTENLNQQAFRFKKQSKRLKQELWWRKCKSNCIVFLILFTLVMMIAMGVCGVKFDKCRSK